MSKRITEEDLVLPSLLIMESQDGFATTADLNDKLRKNFFKKILPEDLKIIAGRKDDYFSQKVRNLKSHNKFQKLGYAKYCETGREWKLTSKGKDKIQQINPQLDYIFSGVFEIKDYQEGLRELNNVSPKGEFIDLNSTVSEGKIEYKVTKTRTRSKKLREVAIKHFKNKNKGSLKCEICKFDFKKAYGKPGKDFIEIHHEKPIFAYEDEGEEQTIRKALNNLHPVCSNCHRVIHKKAREPYKLEQVKKFFNDNNP